MELRPPSIVASLRIRNNVVLVHCHVTGHRRHVATETITRNNIMRSYVRKKVLKISLGFSCVLRFGTYLVNK
jgi:hypothetical protein